MFALFNLGLQELVVLLVLGVLVIGVTPWMAARKGYRWYLWLLPGGLLGIVVVVFLPAANDPSTGPDIIQERQRIGNTVGACLSVLTLVQAAIWALLGGSSV